MKIEARIDLLELKMGGVPGTIIQRILSPDGVGVVWVVGIGRMQDPKVYGVGSTISLALDDVEVRLKEVGMI